MIGWLIVLGVVLLLLFALCLPIYVHVFYEEELEIKIKYLFSPSRGSPAGQTKTREEAAGQKEKIRRKSCGTEGRQIGSAFVETNLPGKRDFRIASFFDRSRETCTDNFKKDTPARADKAV